MVGRGLFESWNSLVDRSFIAERLFQHVRLRQRKDSQPKHCPIRRSDKIHRRSTLDQWLWPIGSRLRRQAVSCDGIDLSSEKSEALRVTETCDRTRARSELPPCSQQESRPAPSVSPPRQLVLDCLGVRFELANRHYLRQLRSRNERQGNQRHRRPKKTR